MSQFIDATGKVDYAKIQKAADDMLDAFHKEKTPTNKGNFAVATGTISPTDISSLNNIITYCKAIVEQQSKDNSTQKMIDKAKKGEDKHKKWEGER